MCCISSFPTSTTLLLRVLAVRQPLSPLINLTLPERTIELSEILMF